VSLLAIVYDNPAIAGLFVAVGALGALATSGRARRGALEAADPMLRPQEVGEEHDY
jgi:hypothetical protein